MYQKVSDAFKSTKACSEQNKIKISYNFCLFLIADNVNQVKNVL